MSIKTEFISILESTAKAGNDIRIQALRTGQDRALTVDGKQAQIGRFQSRMGTLIDAQSEKVKKMVSDKIKSMEAYAETVQRERDKDPAYQSLLATTLSLLPTLADAPAEDLKKRLAPFNEDRLARHAIEKALKAAPSGKEKMYNVDVLPAYTLPDKIERLKKLESTMLSLLLDMGLEVDKMAVLRNCVTPQHIKRLPFYTATADYILACNDDCTEYFPEKHKATQFVKTE